MKVKASSVFYALIMGVLLVYSFSCQKDEFNAVAVLTTKEATEIQQTTAVSGGFIIDDRGTLVTACGVCWSTSKTPTISDSKTEDDTGNDSFISNISGLEPNTTYYVRAYATNRKGTGYGTTYSFTTYQEDGSAGTFTDSRDGNIYKAVKIANKVWMAENLKYLPKVVRPTTGSETAPYYYVYDYTGTDINAAKRTANYSTYGVLYNWPAAMAGSISTANPSGVQGVCPTGWHLPSDAEWTQLIDYLGGDNTAHLKLKETGTAHWESSNGGTNKKGFTALPGGNRYYNGTFNYIGYFVYWWSASQDDTNYAWGRAMGSGPNYSSVHRGSYGKDFGFSVRCVRD